MVRRALERALRAAARALGFTAAFAVGGAAAAAEDGQPARVRFETTLGTFTVETMPEAAPTTVENFLDYVDAGFYDGLIFHRVVPGFVIQAGGYTPAMEPRETNAPIPNESRLTSPDNERGTLSMARTSDPDSATSQFFVNLARNRHLDARPGQPGYAVFARVVEGMETIERIAAVPTTKRAGMANVPEEPVVITDAERLRRGDSDAQG